MTDGSKEPSASDQQTLQKFAERRRSNNVSVNENIEQSSDETDELTYAKAGVDIEATEEATSALMSEIGHIEDEYAGLIHLDNRYLALTTDGVGTKILVAEAQDDYSTVGIDCIAMNVNDLLAVGTTPIAFVDYLAIESPDDSTAAEIGEGIAIGVEIADVYLMGGETAVMPEVISGLDLAGACIGFAQEEETFPRNAKSGDVLVGWPSSGIHSNGLTLARKAVTRNHEYNEPFPPNPDRTIGEELLEPTRIYTDILKPLRKADTNAAAHITGGGWTNLARMGSHRYEVIDPFDAQPIFEFIQQEGNVDDIEMYRTFNMGTGFVAAVPEENAKALVDMANDGRIIGRVKEGEGTVSIRGFEL